MAARWLSSWSLLFAAAACSRPRPSAASAADLALADRHTRGDGVPRDYRKAAELFAHVCDGGRGLPAACRRLALARETARGVPRADGAGELRRVCSAGDWIACAHTDAPDAVSAAAACERGIAEACFAFARSPASGDDDDAAWGARLTAGRRACSGGVVEACAELVREANDGSAGDATVRLTAACRAGDADACDAAGTPVDAAVLCAAHDHAACARRGFAGDPAALAAACDDGDIAEACEGVAVLARDAEHPPANVLALMERACRAGAPRACEQRADELASGCAAFGVDVFAPAVRRAPLPVAGTDGNGTAWRATTGPMITIPPGILSATDLDATADRVSVAVISLHPPGGRHDAGLVRATSVLVDDALAGTPVTTAAYRRAPLALTAAIVLFDAALVPVAALWPNAGRSPPGFSPSSLARCVTHTLATATKGTP